MAGIQVPLDREPHTHDGIANAMRSKRTEKINALIELGFPRIEAQFKIYEDET